MEENHECCGDEKCGCGDEKCGSNEEATMNPANPFGNLDEETQGQIQQLQMLEQSFQQLLMQKNAFSMEANEADLVVSEVEKSQGEVFRIVGGQVVIKSDKKTILDDMNRKKELLSKRMETIIGQEKEFSEKIEALRDEVLKKIQG